MLASPFIHPCFAPSVVAVGVSHRFSPVAMELEGKT